MANQTISQLPDAGPITGNELVPIVQDGGTYKTTASALAGSPVQTQTFLTKNQEPTLNNSRYLSTDANLTITDGGAQSYLRINLAGAAASLNTAGNGFQVKTGLTTVVPRSIAVSTNGITITNGNGVSGNPTIALTGQVLSLANASGAGLVALPNNGTVTPRSIDGTDSEIDVVDGDGAAGNPTIGLADNPIIPGIEGLVVPIGTTGERPSLPTNGTIRYNTQTATFEGYANNAWGSIAAGGGVTSVGLAMPAEFLVTDSPVTSTGVLTADWVSQTANYVLAAPNGSNGTPAFRAFVNDDLPNSGVSANTYGSTTAVPVISVNSKGVITNVTTATIIGGLSYQGGWNASTNTPTLTSSVGTNGYYYVVTTAGSTNLNGITDWQIGDWAIFNGATWQKIDQTNTVSSVNGYTGAVSLTYSDVGAPSTSGTNATGTWGISISGNATTATTATNVAGGATGSVPYNSASGTTTFLALGSTGYVLTAGASAPEYTAQSSLSVGSATTATNVAGGGANQIVYNTGSGATSFITAPVTTGHFLKWNGTTFTWDVAGTGTVTSIDVSGGTTGLSFSGGPVTSSGTITMAGTLGAVNGGTGITGYAVGDIIYANTTTSFDKLGIGASDRILTSTGSSPSWTDPSTITVGIATNAVNVGVAADSTNANYYLGIYSTNTGNLPTKVASGLTANPSTGMMTGGISGGTF